MAQPHVFFSRFSFLSFLFLLCSLHVHGQTKDNTSPPKEEVGEYTKCYYLLTQRASFLAKREKYEESVALFEEAFEGVSKAYVFDYLGAANANAKLGNKKIALEYLKESAFLGLEWQSVLYYKDAFINLLSAEEYEQLELDFKVWRQEFKKGLNLPLYTELVKMDATDQYIRNHVIDKKAIFAKTDNSTAKYERIVDSINTHNLKKIIEEDGFPDIREVGYDGMFIVTFIIVHAGQKNKADCDYFEPILRAEITKGNIRPSDYALVLDAWNARWNKKNLYGSGVSRNGRISAIEDIESLDKRRLEVGLEPYKFFLERRNIPKIPEGYEWKGSDYWSECR